MAKIVKIEKEIVTVEFNNNERREYLKENFLNEIKIGDEVELNKECIFVPSNKTTKTKNIIIYIVIIILIIFNLFNLFNSCLRAVSKAGNNIGNSCKEDFSSGACD